MVILHVKTSIFGDEDDPAAECPASRSVKGATKQENPILLSFNALNEQVEKTGHGKHAAYWMTNNLVMALRGK